MPKDISQLTKITAEVAKISFDVVHRIKKDFGSLPYGQRPMTRAEREESHRMFQSLTMGDMDALEQQYGPEAVNKFIEKHLKDRRY